MRTKKNKPYLGRNVPALKKLLNEEFDHILFQDESMIRGCQVVQYTWFLHGKQRLILTYGKHQGVKLIGVVNYETGKVFCVKEERYDAEAFLRFLSKGT
jgi:hypothetical protein